MQLRLTTQIRASYTGNIIALNEQNVCYQVFWITHTCMPNPSVYPVLFDRKYPSMSVKFWAVIVADLEILTGSFSTKTPAKFEVKTKKKEKKSSLTFVFCHS